MAENLKTDTEEKDVQATSESSIDDWASAFAALEEQGSKETQNADTQSDANSDTNSETSSDGGNTGSIDTRSDEPMDNIESNGNIGGGSFEDSETTISYEDYAKQVHEVATNQAIQHVAKIFIDKGVMNDGHGKLGAYIEHPAIMHRNQDGLPTFINPDTGEPFSGSNPRAEARQWCEEYNKTLAESFGNVVEQQTQAYMKEQEPAMRTVRFAPTYESLDPVRRSMLDNIIEDYEVTDSNNNVIGYSCDLDKALAQVNRIITSIQTMNKAQTPPTEPALDMKDSGESGDNKPPKFNSLEEAMAYEQTKVLEKSKKKGK